MRRPSGGGGTVARCPLQSGSPRPVTPPPGTRPQPARLLRLLPGAGGHPVKPPKKKRQLRVTDPSNRSALLASGTPGALDVASGASGTTPARTLLRGTQDCSYQYPVWEQFRRAPWRRNYTHRQFLYLKDSFSKKFYKIWQFYKSLNVLFLTSVTM